MALSDRRRAFEMYEASNGEVTNRAIAKELDVPEKTISAWKSRYKWNEELGIETRSTAKKKNTTKGSTANTTGRGEKLNKDGSVRKPPSGNPNPKNQFTERNQAGIIHGIYSRYIPKETLEIMNSLDHQTPADILWTQIKILYASIMRSQEIMHVNAGEVIKEINKVKSDAGVMIGGNMDGEIVNEVGYEVQFAWDRQATLLNALSRSMSELRSAIKQFNAIADEDDERRLKLEVMQLKVVETELNIDIKDRTLAAMDDENEDKSININFVRK